MPAQSGINHRSQRRQPFEVVAARLRAGIAEGIWAVGARLPTTREIAQTHGVGLSTVRRALLELAEEGVVRSRQGSGVFVLAKPTAAPADAAHTPASGGGASIGVIIPSHEHFAKAIDGIEQVTRAAGMRLLLACSEGDLNREYQQFRELISAGVSGVIMAPTVDDLREDDPANAMFRPPVPAVVIERTIPGWCRESTVDRVAGNVAAGVRCAVARLVDSGRRRIGYYGWNAGHHAGQSLSGFLRALRDGGLPELPGTIVQGERPQDLDHYLAVCRDQRVDALFFLLEADAVAMLAKLRNAHLRVPDDIAIMEFCYHLAKTAEVPLSGLGLPRDEIGRTAAYLLLRKIESWPDSHVCEVGYRLQLTIRRSCGTGAEPGHNVDLSGTHESPHDAKRRSPLSGAVG